MVIEELPPLPFAEPVVSAVMATLFEQAATPIASASAARIHVFMKDLLCAPAYDRAATR